MLNVECVVKVNSLTNLLWTSLPQKGTKKAKQKKIIKHGKKKRRANNKFKGKGGCVMRLRFVVVWLRVKYYKVRKVVTLLYKI